MIEDDKKSAAVEVASDELDEEALDAVSGGGANPPKPGGSFIPKTVG